MQSLTKTTMIRAGLMALFLVSTLATASTLSAECKDDLDFRWKKNNKRNCDWIGSRKKKKFDKLCAKSKVQKKCPLTCGICADSVEAPAPTATCPAIKPEEGSKCNELAQDERCFYDYRFSGCGSGNLKCEASVEFKCISGEWVEEGIPLVLCTSEYEEQWNTRCEPDVAILAPTKSPVIAAITGCPAIKPYVDVNCNDYDIPKEGCSYDYIAVGCNSQSLSCIPIYHYSCDAPSGIWNVLAMAVEYCELDTVPRGWPRNDCDPDTFADLYSEFLPKDPTLEPTPSPDVFPTPSPTSSPAGSPTGSPKGSRSESESPTGSSANCPPKVPGVNEPCSSPGDFPSCHYGYTVRGCTADALYCGPTAFAQCEESSSSSIPVRDSGGKDVRTRAPAPYAWQVAYFGAEFCEDVPRNWPAGKCDPDTFDAAELLAVLAAEDLLAV